MAIIVSIIEVWFDAFTFVNSLSVTDNIFCITGGIVFLTFIGAGTFLCNLMRINEIVKEVMRKAPLGS